MSDQPDTQTKQSNTPRRGSLLVIFLVVFIDLLGFGMVIPLLPIYATHFSVSENGLGLSEGLQLGLLMASFSAMQFFFAPLWGRLSDRIGRRPVLMIGLAGSAIFYYLFGLATVWKSLTWLFVTRIGAGVMGATISTAQAYIADVTTPQERPRGMALIGMAFGLGFTIGPLFGFLAVPDGASEPGPWPGYAASLLSAVALGLAIFLLPESLRSDSEAAGRPLLDLQGFRQTIGIPSVALVLAAIFVCIFSFANFETTLSMVIKGGKAASDSPFEFSWGKVCLTYAYIGLTLSLIQGGVVRRLAKRLSEGLLALAGAAQEILGFLMMLLALWARSEVLMYIALAVVVSGFSFMQPSLNSLLSRRSDPSQQGMVLGVGQSVSALARIFGSYAGIPLLTVSIYTPYVVASGLMLAGLVLVFLAATSGKDYGAAEAKPQPAKE